ncbi:MAG: DegT/DnrJ/EryC1/StrS aminotransferase family protein [Termitinemataceae bacterium]|nr:MAG: DegT/DnrJ/EryC1/StrS aminotransferase family protein [Termitinemataceae bacterium]
MTDAPKIPFAVPFVGKEEEEAVLRVLRSGWLTTACEALSFEKEFSEFLSCTADAQVLPLQALALNSATSGLHLALESCGVAAGDVVLMPSYTFAADAEAARYLGAEVAFIDCAGGAEISPPAAVPTKPCFNMSIAGLERTLSRLASGQTAYEWGGPSGRPAAVIAVHFGGLVCDIERIVNIAHNYGVKVIEDSAHAFPAKTQDGRWAGTIGDVGVFSFYATKTITTGEGGMLITRNADIANRVSLMRLHGIDRPIWNRYNVQGLQSKSPPWYYEVTEPGYKYNLCDILAAIGRVQLKRATALLAERRKIAARYDEAFAAYEGFVLPPTDLGDARHLYPLRIIQSASCCPSRNDIIDSLRENGIGVSVHFIPLHTMPYYKKRYNLKDDHFPYAYENFCGEISLPIFPGLSKEQIERIIVELKRITC